MWIWLDKNGTVKQYLMHGPSPVVGETNFQIFAYFDGLDTDIIDSATIKFRKPDRQGNTYPILFMKKTSLNYKYMDGDGTMSNFNEEHGSYTGFLFDFGDFSNSEEITKLLDTPGLWEATITLLGISNKTNVSGLITFNVGSSAFNSEDEAQIALDEILENLARITVKKDSNIYLKIANDFVNNATNGNLDASVFVVGSLVLDQETHKFYKIDSVTNNDSDSTKVFATYSNFQIVKTLNGVDMNGTGNIDINSSDIIDITPYITPNDIESGTINKEGYDLFMNHINNNIHAIYKMTVSSLGDLYFRIENYKDTLGILLNAYSGYSLLKVLVSRISGDTANYTLKFVSEITFSEQEDIITLFNQDTTQESKTYNKDKIDFFLKDKTDKKDFNDSGITIENFNYENLNRLKDETIYKIRSGSIPQLMVKYSYSDGRLNVFLLNINGHRMERYQFANAESEPVIYSYNINETINVGAKKLKQSIAFITNEINKNGVTKYNPYFIKPLDAGEVLLMVNDWATTDDNIVVNYTLIYNSKIVNAKVEFNQNADATETNVTFTDNLDNLNTKIETEIQDRKDADQILTNKINTDIAQEKLERQAEDTKLQNEIDAMKEASDVFSIVQNKAKLNRTDWVAQGITNNDIVKVLTDETKDYATTYYQWLNDIPGFNPEPIGVLDASITKIINKNTADDLTELIWLAYNDGKFVQGSIYYGSTKNDGAVEITTNYLKTKFLICDLNGYIRHATIEAPYQLENITIGDRYLEADNEIIKGLTDTRIGIVNKYQAQPNNAKVGSTMFVEAKLRNSVNIYDNENIQYAPDGGITFEKVDNGIKLTANKTSDSFRVYTLILPIADFNLEKGKTYIFSCDGTEQKFADSYVDTEPCNITIQLINNNDYSISDIGVYAYKDGRLAGNRPFTITDEVVKFRIVYTLSQNVLAPKVKVGDYVIFKDIQIQEGLTITPYEPYNTYSKGRVLQYASKNLLNIAGMTQMPVVSSKVGKQNTFTLYGLTSDNADVISIGNNKYNIGNTSSLDRFSNIKLIKNHEYLFMTKFSSWITARTITDIFSAYSDSKLEISIFINEENTLFNSSTKINVVKVKADKDFKLTSYYYAMKSGGVLFVKKTDGAQIDTYDEVEAQIIIDLTANGDHNLTPEEAYTKYSASFDTLANGDSIVNKNYQGVVYPSFETNLYLTKPNVNSYTLTIYEFANEVSYEQSIDFSKLELLKATDYKNNGLVTIQADTKSIAYTIRKDNFTTITPNDLITWANASQLEYGNEATEHEDYIEPILIGTFDKNSDGTQKTFSFDVLGTENQNLGFIPDNGFVTIDLANNIEDVTKSTFLYQSTNLANEVAVLNGKVKNLESDNANHEQRITSLEAKNVEQDESIANLQEQVNGFSGSSKIIDLTPYITPTSFEAGTITEEGYNIINNNLLEATDVCYQMTIPADNAFGNLYLTVKSYISESDEVHIQLVSRLGYAQMVVDIIKTAISPIKYTLEVVSDVSYSYNNENTIFTILNKDFAQSYDLYSITGTEAKIDEKINLADSKKVIDLTNYLTFSSATEATISQEGYNLINTNKNIIYVVNLPEFGKVHLKLDNILLDGTYTFSSFYTTPNPNGAVIFTQVNIQPNKSVSYIGKDLQIEGTSGGSGNIDLGEGLLKTLIIKAYQNPDFQIGNGNATDLDSQGQIKYGKFLLTTEEFFDIGAEYSLIYNGKISKVVLKRIDDSDYELIVSNPYEDQLENTIGDFGYNKQTQILSDLFNMNTETPDIDQNKPAKLYLKGASLLTTEIGKQNNITVVNPIPEGQTSKEYYIGENTQGYQLTDDIKPFNKKLFCSANDQVAVGFTFNNIDSTRTYSTALKVELLDIDKNIVSSTQLSNRIILDKSFSLCSISRNTEIAYIKLSSDISTGIEFHPEETIKNIFAFNVTKNNLKEKIVSASDILNYTYGAVDLLCEEKTIDKELKPLNLLGKQNIAKTFTLKTNDTEPRFIYPKNDNTFGIGTKDEIIADNNKKIIRCEKSQTYVFIAFYQMVGSGSISSAQFKLLGSDGVLKDFYVNKYYDYSYAEAKPSVQGYYTPLFLVVPNSNLVDFSIFNMSFLFKTGRTTTSSFVSTNQKILNEIVPNGPERKTSNFNIIQHDINLIPPVKQNDEQESCGLVLKRTTSGEYKIDGTYTTGFSYFYIWDADKDNNGEKIFLKENCRLPNIPNANFKLSLHTTETKEETRNYLNTSGDNQKVKGRWLYRVVIAGIKRTTPWFDPILAYQYGELPKQRYPEILYENIKIEDGGYKYLQVNPTKFYYLDFIENDTNSMPVFSLDENDLTGSAILYDDKATDTSWPEINAKVDNNATSIENVNTSIEKLNNEIFPNQYNETIGITSNRINYYLIPNIKYYSEEEPGYHGKLYFKGQSYSNNFTPTENINITDNGLTIAFDTSTQEFTINGTTEAAKDIILSSFTGLSYNGDTFTMCMYKNNTNAVKLNNSYFQVLVKKSDIVLTTVTENVQSLTDKLLYDTVYAPNSENNDLVLKIPAAGIEFTNYKFKIALYNDNVPHAYTNQQLLTQFDIVDRSINLFDYDQTLYDGVNDDNLYAEAYDGTVYINGSTTKETSEILIADNILLKQGINYQIRYIYSEGSLDWDVYLQVLRKRDDSVVTEINLKDITYNQNQKKNFSIDTNEKVKVVLKYTSDCVFNEFYFYTMITDNLELQDDIYVPYANSVIDSVEISNGQEYETEFDTYKYHYIELQTTGNNLLPILAESQYITNYSTFTYKNEKKSVNNQLIDLERRTNILDDDIDFKTILFLGSGDLFLSSPFVNKNTEIPNRLKDKTHSNIIVEADYGITVSENQYSGVNLLNKIDIVDIENKADVVFISLGNNDYIFKTPIADFERDLKLFYDKINAKYINKQVIVLLPLKLKDTTYIHSDLDIEYYLEIMYRVTQDYGYQTVDLQKLIGLGYLKDNNRLTEYGTNKVVKILYDAIINTNSAIPSYYQIPPIPSGETNVTYTLEATIDETGKITLNWVKKAA